MKQNKQLDILIEHLFYHISAEMRHAFYIAPDETIIDIFGELQKLPKKEWAIFGARFTSFYHVLKSVSSYIETYSDETTKHDFERLKDISEYYKECESMGLKYKVEVKSHE